MAQTPKKSVHWNMASPSLSVLDSPYFDVGDESSMDSTSSLDFVNSQLVAHGFVDAGLSLNGLGKDDSSRLVKCMLALLGQRVQDMTRTEDLTTKLRTLNYDKERLESMNRAANEKCANAERETNMHKSRLATALKQLQAAESSTKQANAELQRTRTMLQGVRSTHVAELKKKDKEIERIMDKWQKLADNQTKLGATASGIRCANAAVVEGNELLGKGPGFLDVALEQADQARTHLDNENLGLRKAFVRIINEMQNVLHQAQSLPGSDLLEPTPYTLTTLFPLAPQDFAIDKATSLLASMREAIVKLSTPVEEAPSADKGPQVTTADVERLQGVISELREELAKSQKQSMANLAETQQMFDKFSAASDRIGDMSVELMNAPSQDDEKERLEALRMELDAERQKFADAAVRLGKDKASLEAERLKLLDEKRAWQVEKMLSEIPAAPISDTPTSPHRPSKKIHAMSPHRSPHKALQYPKSPRRSPAKNVCVGKAGSGRKAHRVSRRSLASPVVLSYETEVIPPILGPTPSLPPLKLNMAPASSLLPTSFVLPPPSPRASLPTKPVLPSSSKPEPKRSTTPESPEETYTPPSSTDASPELLPANLPESPESPPSMANTNRQNNATTTTTTNNNNNNTNKNNNNLLQVPETPAAAKRPFPVAKPFAQRMIHAYSPAKPSPLSRMLMLTDSPLTPPLLAHAEPPSPSYGSLDPVAEEAGYDNGNDNGNDDDGYGDGGDDDGGLEYITNTHARPLHPTKEARMSASELGVDSPPDTPLQEKKIETNLGGGGLGGVRGAQQPLAQPNFNQRGRVFRPAETTTGAKPVIGKKPAVPSLGRDKGKGRALDTGAPVARSRTSALGEKENTLAVPGATTTKLGGGRSGKVSPLPPGGGGGGGGAQLKSSSLAGAKQQAAKSVMSSTATSRARVPVKPPVPTAGGPRRVPINSVDAPPIGKGWKG